MKNKVLLMAVGLLLLATIVQAQANKNNYYELGGTVMILSPISSKGLTIYGGGVNFSGITYFKDNIGLGIYDNFVFAGAQGTTMFLIDVLFGPVFRIAQNDQFSLPIALGLNADLGYIFKKSSSALAFNIGIGANLSAEFKLNEKYHLYTRFQIAYGLLGGGELFITPCIGLGF